MNNPKLIISIATLLLAIAVAAGAFGAHALKNTLTPERLDTWETAVQYHAWHALGLILVALIGAYFQVNIMWPASLLLAGILIFSGSLYTLCLSGIGWLGAITPIGGVAFIAGWIVLAIQFFRAEF
ncbi:DUF423 domain-containing protein [Gracilimonas mengyeensis]|uniref:Uncharacterized membrane protein YgdD, TMEM256/DUF423 family n=1 Tax=Gracilimonas mengyeensis TaxID=1302730 RepID=A0A521CYG9_9BACT|nr:DUF423 domain-containing protein [Gracilimonas mengyeensis]SMO63801.1 Uncharacterized membrane protein YgdD, TMEM256/DUF423 family [Gracilimonas mengyeensis]